MDAWSHLIQLPGYNSSLLLWSFLNSSGKYVCKRASWVSGLRKSLILLLAWFWPDFALSGWEGPWKCFSQMEPLKWVTGSAYRHSLLLLKNMQKTPLILLFQQFDCLSAAWLKKKTISRIFLWLITNICVHMIIDCKTANSVSVDRESKNVFAPLEQPCAAPGDEPVTSLSRIISSACRCAETPLPFHTVETKWGNNFLLSQRCHTWVCLHILHTDLWRVSPHESISGFFFPQEVPIRSIKFHQSAIINENINILWWICAFALLQPILKMYCYKLITH